VKLTSKVIVEALLRSSDEINAQFSRLPVRIGQSFTILENNLTGFFGRLDSATGTTSALADTVKILADNLGLVATAGVAAVTSFSASTVVAGFATATNAVKGFVTTQYGAIASQVEYNRLLGEGKLIEIGSAAATAERTKLVASTAAANHEAALASNAAAVASRDALEAQFAAIQSRSAEALSTIQRSKRLRQPETAKGAAERVAIIKASSPSGWRPRRRLRRNSRPLRARPISSSRPN